MAGWACIQTTQIFSVSAIRAPLSYHLCVYWSRAFTFLQALFLCIHNLADWYKRPRVQPLSAFHMLFSLSLIISGFSFKVRDVQLFLLIKHSEATVGLLIALISVLLYLREQGGLRRGRKTGGMTSEWRSQNTHSIYQLSSPSYMGVAHGIPKQ